MGTTRCAEWARAVEADPAGTAPQTDVFVLVEHPLPWPADIAEDPLLAELQDVAAGSAPGRSVRLQAVACDATAEERQVIVFAAAPPFAGYGRRQAGAAPGDLARVVRELVAAPPPPPSGAVTDVLICTHGSRDTCCGSLGTRLWLQQDAPSVHVWRTSHTGGHRFAPTAITFPDGNYWARLTADRLAGVVDRTLEPAVAADHLRGCASFSAAAQVADRAIFAVRGWPWLATPRFVEERSPSRVELCFEAPDGERGCYVVYVEPGRQLPVPDCGGDPAGAAKQQTELRATHVQAWV